MTDPTSGRGAAESAGSPEPGWRVTNRGTVFPWEVDTVGHLTVAYYVERFADAALGALEAVDLGPAYMARTGLGLTTEDCYIRYERELRAGDILHIESGLIGGDASGVVLGHRLFDSATGSRCATVEQRTVHRARGGAPLPLPAAARRAVAAQRVVWDGPAREARPVPRGLDGLHESARDTVKPWEVDVFGQSALRFYVHRFSAAGSHIFARFGMTPAYQREQQRGFSTFEFQLAFLEALHPGDLVSVWTGLLHVGRSSLRIFHRMVREPGGEVVATLDQFGVHLDTALRRPTPLPDALRARAVALVAEGASPGEGPR